MSVLDIMEKRYSVRGYLDKEVEDEKLNKVLRAAQIAPTGVNAQAFKIYSIITCTTVDCSIVSVVLNRIVAYTASNRNVIIIRILYGIAASPTNQCGIVRPIPDIVATGRAEDGRTVTIVPNRIIA